MRKTDTLGDEQIDTAAKRQLKSMVDDGKLSRKSASTAAQERRAARRPQADTEPETMAFIPREPVAPGGYAEDLEIPLQYPTPSSRLTKRFSSKV